ncbi:hypothetical protein [Helicobacter colisuis]|uniref:hypothetical protein n=1 Tax=Helicobacter colisuis TaxID=2949739 RepID=UPI00202A07B1|nr:hypothetical protein [Helicobacter colisuis]MCL9822307.1 hypothetical protein [Helicobacter colisuis]
MIFVRLILILFCNVMLFGVEETAISNYLRKEIHHQNPLNNYKKFGDMFGVPLPVIEEKIPKHYKQPFYKEKEEVKSLIDENAEWDAYSLSNKVFNSTLKAASPIFSEQLNNVAGIYIPKVEFKVNLNSYFTRDDQNIGGDFNLNLPILEYEDFSLLLVGGFSRDPQTLNWGEKYGIKHQVENVLLQNLVLMQSVVQNNEVVNEQTWNYGVEYSPFKSIKLFLQRENNRIQEDNTKAGIQYRFLF